MPAIMQAGSKLRRTPTIFERLINVSLICCVLGFVWLLAIERFPDGLANYRCLSRIAPESRGHTANLEVPTSGWPRIRELSHSFSNRFVTDAGAGFLCLMKIICESFLISALFVPKW